MPETIDESIDMMPYDSKAGGYVDPARTVWVHADEGGIEITLGPRDSPDAPRVFIEARPDGWHIGIAPDIGDDRMHIVIDEKERQVVASEACWPDKFRIELSY